MANAWYGVLTPFQVADMQAVVLAYNNPNAAPLTAIQQGIERFALEGRILCPHPRNTPFVTHVFTTRLCPPGFVILHVWGGQSNRKPYCRWTVVYRTQNPNDMINDPKGIERRLDESPRNGKVVPNSFRRIPINNNQLFYYTLEFSVARSKCSCPNFCNLTTPLLAADDLNALLGCSKMLGNIEKSFIRTRCVSTILERMESKNPSFGGSYLEDVSNWSELDKQKSFLLIHMENKVGIVLSAKLSTKKSKVLLKCLDGCLNFYLEDNELICCIPKYLLEKDVVASEYEIRTVKGALLILFGYPVKS